MFFILQMGIAPDVQWARLREAWPNPSPKKFPKPEEMTQTVRGHSTASFPHVGQGISSVAFPPHDLENIVCRLLAITSSLMAWNRRQQHVN